MAKKAIKRTRTRPARKKPVPKKRNASGSPIFDRLGKFIVPITLSAAVVLALMIVVYLTYDSVTTSKFFDLKGVRISGSDRASRTDIESIVKANADKTGVWNADLLEIKQKIEKVTFVKAAAVSRDLPSGISVAVTERLPVAAVKLGSGEYFADADGILLSKIDDNDKTFPFAITGWDEAKSDRADRDNAERLKLYQKMYSEWTDYNLVSRVRSVDLSDTKEPKAVLEDSGLPVTITLGRDNFGQQLSNGIKAIVGKGNMFEGVELVGANMRLIPRKQ